MSIDKKIDILLECHDLLSRALRELEELDEDDFIASSVYYWPIKDVQDDIDAYIRSLK